MSKRARQETATSVSELEKIRAELEKAQDELEKARNELEKAREKIKADADTLSNIDAMCKIINGLLEAQKTTLVQSVMQQEAEGLPDEVASAIRKKNVFVSETLSFEDENVFLGCHGAESKVGSFRATKEKFGPKVADFSRRGDLLLHLALAQMDFDAIQPVVDLCKAKLAAVGVDDNLEDKLVQCIVELKLRQEYDENDPMLLVSNGYSGLHQVPADRLSGDLRNNGDVTYDVEGTIVSVEETGRYLIRDNATGLKWYVTHFRPREA